MTWDEDQTDVIVLRDLPGIRHVNELCLNPRNFEYPTVNYVESHIAEVSIRLFGITQRETEYSYQWIGAAKGWPLGAFANTGKGSALVASGSGALVNGIANNLIDHGPIDVDAYKAVVNLPIVLVAGEYYNQGEGGGSTANGVVLANNLRTYAAARKTADPSIYMIGCTSTASFNRQGATRDGFNASLVSNPGQFNAMVSIHTNASIGVDGAAGTTGAANTNFADGIHPSAAGYSVFASVLGPFLT